MEDFHHQVAHAIIHLPFAHVSGIKSHPLFDAIEKWHSNNVAPQLAAATTALTTHIQSSIHSLKLPSIPKVSASIAQASPIPLSLDSVNNTMNDNNDNDDDGQEHMQRKDTSRQPRAIFARRKVTITNNNNTTKRNSDDDKDNNINKKNTQQSIATTIAAAIAATTSLIQQQQKQQRNSNNNSNSNQQQSTSSPSTTTTKNTINNKTDNTIICIELSRGKRRIYSTTTNNTNNTNNNNTSSVFDIEDENATHHHRLGIALSEYLLPQGYPTSVAPQYSSYMTWRGIQYFFGGAMSVFTTRSLLKALGVANKHSGEAAAAINWVVKDGAGRLGRFLFARWGRSLDCELKQFRLAGDVLMEAGAAMELSTALAPTLFLPLACTANLAKNLAAVAASSTRAPIYRTFALSNNMADVTAKGESVANLADIFGTAFGIALARWNLPIVPTFAALSVGYLVASRREVDSVELPYFNRARLSYAARAFLSRGNVPDIKESNQREPLLPWRDPTAGRIVLGATVEEAVKNPSELYRALEMFKSRRGYALAYRDDTKKVYILLKEKNNSGSSGSGSGGKGGGRVNNNDSATTVHKQDAVLSLQAAFEAHALLHMIDHNNNTTTTTNNNNNAPYYEQALQHVAQNGLDMYKKFEKEAIMHGWKVDLTMLNPRETRVIIM